MRNKKMILFIIGGLLAVLILAFFAVAPMVGERVKNTVLIESKNLINGEVSLSDAKLIWLNKVQLNNLVVKKDGKVILNAPKVNLSIAVWNIFSDNKLALLDSVTAYSPTVNVHMYADERWNVQDLLKPQPVSKNKFASMINLRNATLNISMKDRLISAVIDGSIDSRSGDDNYALDLETRLADAGTLKVVGLINAKQQGRLNIKSKDLNLAGLKDLLYTYVPVAKVSGTVSDIDIIWQNKDNKKLLNARMNAQNVCATYVHDKKEYNLSINGPISLKDSIVEFKQTQVKINEQLVTLSGGVLGEHNNWLPNNLQVNMENADLGALLADKTIEGKISGQAILQTTDDGLVVEGKLNSTKIKIQDYLLTDINVPFKYQKGLVFANNVQMGVLDGKVTAKAVYNINEQRYNLEIDGKNLDLTRAKLDEDIKGRGDVRLVASGTIDAKNKDIDLAGNLQIDNFSYRGLSVKALTADIVKFKQEIGIYNGSATLEDAGRAAFYGTLNQDRADVFITAGRFPLSFIGEQVGVQADGWANITAHVAGDRHNPQAGLTLSAGRGSSIMGQKIDSMMASVKLQDNICSIVNFNAITSGILDTPQGEYSLAGTIDNQSGIPNLDIKVVTRGIRVDDIIRENFEFKATGFLDNEMRISGPLNNLSVVGKGRLYEGSVMGVNVQYITSDYSYQHGVLSIPQLDALSLNNMHCTISGKMLANGELDFKVGAEDIQVAYFNQLSAYNPSGLVDFEGLVSGNIRRPQLSGKVQSSKLNIIGEEYVNINGKIQSDAGLKTSVDLDFQEIKGGKFAFSGTLDYEERYAFGKFIVSKGNIAPFMALTKEKYDIKGLLDGEVHLNRRGKGTGLEIIGSLKQASVAGVALQEADVDIGVTRNSIAINKLLALQGANGKLEAYGGAEINGTANIMITGTNLDARLLNVFLKDKSLTGTLDLNASITGRTKRPQVTAKLVIENGSFADTGFDKFAADVSLTEDERLVIKEAVLQKQEFNSQISGYIPLDLFREKSARRRLNDEMNLTLKTNSPTLGFLSASKHISYSSGTVAGQLKISGDLENPRFYGAMRIDNGVIKLGMLKNPFTDINVELSFIGQNVKLINASAKLGKGTIKLGGNFNISQWQQSQYELWGKVENADLASPYVKGLLTGDFSIKPHVRRKRPVLTVNTNLENITFNIPTLLDFGDDTATNLGLDLNVQVGKNVRVVNRMLYDLFLKGGVRVRGSLAYPVISGSMEVTKGTITYLRTPFKIESANLGFPLPGTFVPSVNILATTRLLQTDITMIARGKLTQMDFKLTSNPPYSQQELFRMLTLKTQGASSEVGSGDARGLVLTGLQMSILGDFEYKLRESLGLAEFRIYQGELNTGTSLELVRKSVIRNKKEQEQYNVLLSKNLTDKLLLGYTTSSDFNYYMLYAQYSFDKRLSFSAGIDEMRRNRFALEYKIAF